ALESRSENGCRSASYLRQAARLPQSAFGWGHKISLGGESAFASCDASASLRAQREYAVFSGDPGTPGKLVRLLSLRSGTELVQRARGGDQADQLVYHV